MGDLDMIKEVGLGAGVLGRGKVVCVCVSVCVSVRE